MAHPGLALPAVGLAARALAAVAHPQVHALALAAVGLAPALAAVVDSARAVAAVAHPAQPLAQSLAAVSLAPALAAVVALPQVQLLALAAQPQQTQTVAAHVQDALAT